ncbi:HNH endonuclease [Bacillus sp. IT-79MI2]|uniref:hypothetical protein n=1 Tax=Bacillus sp. IT-79MI2 TaxID=3026438 RepID=UPI0039E1A0A5
MVVKKQNPIKFINKCRCIVDYRELEKAILWHSQKCVTSLKTISLHGRYPAVSIHGEKIHVHRLLMMYWEGRTLVRKEQVHHKDENKLNSSKDNLEIMLAGEHQRIHSKGKKISEAHKRKIVEANKKRKGTKIKKSVEIPITELKKYLDKRYSINAIAKLFDCDWSTVRNRIRDNPELLKGDGENE